MTLGGGYGFCTSGQDFIGRPVPLRGLQPSLPTHRRGHAHRRARLSRWVCLLFYLRRPRCSRQSVSIRFHDFASTASGLDLRLDILDTGGSYVFPAMRTLAIKSADGFILVCAADDPPSLEVHAISRVALFPLDDFPKKFALPSNY